MVIEMNIIWSNTFNQEVIDYVKNNASKFDYELIKHDIFCSCVQNSTENETLYIYLSTIKQIDGRDVEDLFKGICAITVMRCPTCNCYAIDIDE